MDEYKAFENIHQVFEFEKWFHIEETVFREIEERCFRYKRDFNLIVYFNETLKAYSPPEKMAILKDLEKHAAHKSNWSGLPAHNTLKDYISRLESETPTPKKPTIEPDMPKIKGKTATTVVNVIEAYYLITAKVFEYGKKSIVARYNIATYNRYTEYSKKRLDVDYIAITEWVINNRLQDENAKNIAINEVNEATKKSNNLG